MSFLSAPRRLARIYDKERLLSADSSAISVYRGKRERRPSKLHPLPVRIMKWKLQLGGLIADKRPWTTRQIAALPQRDAIIRHICVEGWDYIGEWSGVPLGDFLKRVGADLSAKYVAFQTADNDPSSLDMATALHPQTLLATRYAGAPLADPFGLPLRLRTSTKLGFKNPKWITSVEVTNAYPSGYWEKQGFNWFSGL